jgi:peptidoglycan hydrolase-like protein with peptidoglycan-binding domain
MSDGTVKALSDFQSASGLEVSGKATPETVEALMSDTEATVTP